MKTQSIQTIILCGGEGLRFKNNFASTSKMMASIDDKPVLWHIMNHYASYGYCNFILCVKDDDDEISQYFNKENRDWNIKIKKTGNQATTTGRLLKIASLIQNKTFFVTYGDGLSDVNIRDLLSHHLQYGKMITLTAVQPFNQYGILQIEKDGCISLFEEKPRMKEWVNGGFFVMNKKVLDLLDKNKSLEDNLIDQFLPAKEITAYRFDGFWKSIDTYKDYLDLLEMFKERK